MLHALVLVTQYRHFNDSRGTNISHLQINSLIIDTNKKRKQISHSLFRLRHFRAFILIIVIQYLNNLLIGYVNVNKKCLPKLLRKQILSTAITTYIAHYFNLYILTQIISCLMFMFLSRV